MKCVQNQDIIQEDSIMDNDYTAGITTPTGKHQPENRTFQGIPGIAVSPHGRIFTVCYSGGHDENGENYVVLWFSDDRGVTWNPPVAVVDPVQADIRAFDAVPWFAPDGRLFLFWAQGRTISKEVVWAHPGVWFSVLENPDDPPEMFRWSTAERIADGVMMNKPIVLSDGTWALPVSVWSIESFVNAGEDVGTKMFVSEDNGKSFRERGRFLLPPEFRCFDEHSFVELSDGRIRCVARILQGYADAWSSDGGRTWTPAVRSDIPGPNSRLFITKLQSGRLLLVRNEDPEMTEEVIRERNWRPRKNMTAYLSDDDGASWYGGLLLDGCEQVSYPDGQQVADGTIWIVHDRARYRGCKIVVSCITEEDVAAGRLVSTASRLGIIASVSASVPGEDIGL